MYVIEFSKNGIEIGMGTSKFIIRGILSGDRHCTCESYTHTEEGGTPMVLGDFQYPTPYDELFFFIGS